MSTVTLVHPEGVALTHIAGGGSDYATVCGIAVDGDEFSARVAPACLQRKKVDCPECITLWHACHTVSASKLARA